MTDVDVRSFLSSYRPDLFLGHREWERLARILRARGGGSYGISGPRGAGKTWLMRKAKEWAEDEHGLGVLFPSPSEYEPTAFLAAISDVVAARYEEWDDERTGRTTLLARRQWMVTVIVVTTAWYAAGALIALGVVAGGNWVHLGRYLNAPVLGGVAVLLASFAVYATGRRRYRRDREGAGRVRRRAEELRIQVRYAVTTKESSELGAEGARLGLTARLRRARERELVERPATLSSLIHNFRAFVEQMAAVIDGPVVIAVDELDKMTHGERVAELLRDIKGIFDVGGAVYFLVSISDEAARNLELGAVRSRDEFNSSFYTVLRLPPLQPDQCAALLKMRIANFDDDVGLAIGIMSGGVAREVVRLAERAVEAPTLESALREAMGEEVDAFLNQVLTAPRAAHDGHAPLGAAERLMAFNALTRASSGIGGLPMRSGLAYWRVNDHDPEWRAAFQEEWHRLLLRLGVADLIVGAPWRLEKRADRRFLQDIVQTTSAAAAVGRAMLAAYVASEASGRGVRVDELSEPDVELTCLLFARNAAALGRSEIATDVGLDQDAVQRSLDRLHTQRVVTKDCGLRGAQWRLSNAACASRSGSSRPKTSGPSLARGQRSPT